MTRKRHDALIGQRYHELQAGPFGRSALEWIIEGLFIGVDGLDYAQLACAANPLERKTLSVLVLNDRRRFTRVAVEPA